MAWKISEIKILRHLHRRFILGLALWLTLIPFSYAQDLDKETAGLADRIARALVAKGKKKIAVTDFVDLQGRASELGRFLAEQLSVELVNSPGTSVMDRANLKSILAEHKLSEEGLVNPETAKQLGQFAGVDVILIGTVTPLDNGVVLTVKAVSTDTAEIAAASRATFSNSKEIQQLLSHGVANITATASPSESRPKAIAVKDLGNLRVTLTDIRHTTIDIFGRGQTPAVHCVLELANLNLREPLSFAVNGEAQNSNSPRARMLISSGFVLGVHELNGISCVAVNYRNPNPAAIASALMTRPEPGYAPWVGNMLTIPAGESIQATITFSQGTTSGQTVAISDSVQFECELVIGVASPNGRPSFRLYNLVWGNINLPE